MDAKDVILTVTIVTKDRPKELRRLLDSLSLQLSTRCPVEVLIIDNSREGSVKKVYLDYIKMIPFLKYEREQRQGAVFARNKALTICQSHYLAFVDDDCVLDANWLKKALLILKRKRREVVYWQGASMLANQQNAWTVAQFRQTEHSVRTYVKDKTLLQFHVDTKNLILDVSVLRKKKILFDERFGFLHSCGFEDVDLGMTMNRLGLMGEYRSDLLVSHQEPAALGRVFSKYFNRGRISVEAEKKWLYCQKFCDFKMVFYDYRLIIRSLLNLTEEKKIFWCLEFLDLFYYWGFLYERWRQSINY